MALTLPDDTRDRLAAVLQGYFRDERDEEIGSLQALFLLDFVLKEIGPSVYNQAIRDAQAHLHAVLADLDVTLYEREGGADRASARR